ncbi:unnamed protein product [Didymodactylos carnosus]|uniref:Integrase catalytic domain-containing protein n=1 Tax=Didymodactylos carnosus TaxID=1234261 RepID=A0A815HI15_9BILA|nr:unnamed protein product [Didymodactylos carnosus]CAF4222364.1 unnamed protein product [Didymodactylos carnosus]
MEFGLVVDKSSVGLGAILTQVNSKDARDKRVLSFASRALSDLERRYSQIEKEGLACVWGCEKFHMYLYGRIFTLVTDNKALQYIFKNPKAKTSARIERMCLRLAQYDFIVKYHPGKCNPSDYLARNPIIPEFEASNESLYDRLIDIAHDGHQGVKKTKALLRSNVYFPGLDKLINARLSSCYTCQTNSPTVQHEPCQTSELPSSPWQLIALDFYGATDSGTYLLLITDVYARFVIIHEVNTTASHYILSKLHESLPPFGIPQIVKTDNGPPFNGAEFDNFCNYYGLKYRAITPYWPRANAEAERFMQNLRKVFQNANINQIDLLI